MTLLLAIVLWAPWATPPQRSDAKVQDLIVRLDDDAPSAREKATSELLECGTSAVPALLLARAGTLSEEVKARIGFLLSALGDPGRSTADGGSAVSGIRVELRLAAGNASGILLEARFQNVSEVPRPFCPIRLWNKRVPGEGFISNLSEAEVDVRALSGEAPKKRAWKKFCAGGPNPRTVVSLKPGDMIKSECWLDLRSLAPGEYSIQLEYYSKGLLEASENLKSNDVVIKIGS